jgi:hypothetical protein
MRGHLYSSPLNLHKGWNWMAYTYSSARDLSVIQNAAEGDYIASQRGFAEYSNDAWEGTLTELTPGEGYLYKSAADKALELAFETPAGARAAYRNATAASDIPEMAYIMRRYPNTMNMTARILRDGMELPGKDYNVYAFAGNEMRGVSQFVGSNHYLTVYGDQPVTISFVIEAVETGDSYVAKETRRGGQPQEPVRLQHRHSTRHRPAHGHQPPHDGLQPRRRARQPRCHAEDTAQPAEGRLHCQWSQVFR